ncbi:MAG: NmrA family NAD(P)-binding protein [Bacteroidota bacterium]
MYVIIGATGNTGKEITHALLDNNKPVKVISRQLDHLKPFTERGAIATVGNLEDTNFLKETFAGATAVYALIPPRWDVTHWRNYQREIATSITQALKEAQVKHVVVLSSNGAQLKEGAGPVSGLHEFEEMLKQVEGLNMLSLRAGFFMQNFFGLMDMMKGMNAFGYSLNKDVKTPIVHTKDIAEVAVKHLLALDFEGFEKVFVAGNADLTMEEVATTLGKAIGKPALKYISFTPEEAKAGSLKAGIPATIAEGYNELFDALNKGTYLNDYQRTPENTTSTTLAWFAENEFAPAYQATMQNV